MLFHIVSHSLIQSINIILSCSLVLLYLFNFVVCCSGTLTPGQLRHLPKNCQPSPWVLRVINTLCKHHGQRLFYFVHSSSGWRPGSGPHWAWICFCDSYFLKRLWCDVSSDDFVLSSIGIGDVSGAVIQYVCQWEVSQQPGEQRLFSRLLHHQLVCSSGNWDGP